MFYTYAHITLDTNKIFYIGKGADRRMFRRDARNQHWHNVVKKHGFKAVKLADWDNAKDAFEHEKVLIQSFKDIGYKLVNQSLGGDGNDALGGFSFKGKKQSDSAKEKCRLGRLGKKASEQAKQKNALKHMKQIKINGVLYPSWQEASKITGIPTGSISYLLKSKPTKGKWVGYTLEKVM
jgi:hypothetical protein